MILHTMVRMHLGFTSACVSATEFLLAHDHPRPRNSHIGLTPVCIPAILSCSQVEHVRLGIPRHVPLAVQQWQVCEALMLSVPYSTVSTLWGALIDPRHSVVPSLGNCDRMCSCPPWHPFAHPIGSCVCQVTNVAGTHLGHAPVVQTLLLLHCCCIVFQPQPQA